MESAAFSQWKESSHLFEKKTAMDYVLFRLYKDDSIFLRKDAFSSMDRAI